MSKFERTRLHLPWSTPEKSGSFCFVFVFVFVLFLSYITHLGRRHIIICHIICFVLFILRRLQTGPYLTLTPFGWRP